MFSCTWRAFRKGSHQTTVSYPGLWPFSPVAHFDFKAETNEYTGKLMRWPGSRSHLSLPARCTVSAPSISRNTNQGNTTLAQELCDCVGTVPLGTPLPYQLALQLSPLGVRGRMQAMLRRRRDKRNARANKQQVIKLLLIPLKPWGLLDLKSSGLISCICKRGAPHPLSPPPTMTENWVHVIMPFSKILKCWATKDSYKATPNMNTENDKLWAVMF